MPQGKPTFLPIPRSRADRNAMCRWKRKFSTAEQATDAYPEQRAYYCPFCGFWHLTSKK